MALDPNSSERARILRPGVRIGAVVSQFHEDLTGAMLESARDELVASGMDEEDYRVVWVPGSFELAIVARRLAARKDNDPVLCFGLVLKGETTHDVYVAHGAVQGIVRASLDADKPILFGVLTCETLAQARSRALSAANGGKEDKGRELARAAVAVLAALDEVDGTPAIEVKN
jgi:6,7-dimethyl-8-ribityllumazine synthase